MTARPARPRERGQALVETAIGIVIFVFLALGIIEFGRAWMIANMITHAARDGARIAAKAANRNASGDITNKAAIQDQVKAEIQNVMTTALDVSVTQPPAVNGIPLVQVQVSGTVPYLFNLPGIGTSFQVDRIVTFRDEGR